MQSENVVESLYQYW